jgi:hypothetical protein
MKRGSIFFFAGLGFVVLAMYVVSFLAFHAQAQPTVPGNTTQPTPIGGFNGGSSMPAFLPFRILSLANSFPAAGTSFPSAGAHIAEKGPRWAAISTPVSGTQAIITVASVTGVRHVVDCIGIAAAAASSVTGITSSVALLDGSTGIWGYYIGFPTGSTGAQEVPPISFCGLNLVGTTNTAMVLEFGAGVTGASESLSISGFDIQ